MLNFVKLTLIRPKPNKSRKPKGGFLMSKVFSTFLTTLKTKGGYFMPNVF